MHKLVANREAVILDMDGVLVDTEPIHVRSFEVFLKKLSVDYNMDDLHALVGHSIDENIITINQKYLKEAPLPVAEGVRRRNNSYMDILRQEPIIPLPGIVDLVDFCGHYDLKLALATSSTMAEVDIILDQLQDRDGNKIELRSCFQSIVSGDLVARKKPAPDIYLKTLENLNVAPDKTLTIEDSKSGVASAKTAGITVIGLPNQYHDADALRQADALVDSVEDVVQWFVQLKT